MTNITHNEERQAMLSQVGVELGADMYRKLVETIQTDGFGADDSDTMFLLSATIIQMTIHWSNTGMHALATYMTHDKAPEICDLMAKIYNQHGAAIDSIMKHTEVTAARLKTL